MTEHVPFPRQRHVHRRRWLTVLALAAVPSAAFADGGGPILILAGPVVFLVAQVWIIAIEMYVLRRLVPAVAWKDAWEDVVAANLRSYVQVGIVLPFAMTLALPLLGGGLGFVIGMMGLPSVSEHLGGFAAGLGGWIFDSEDAVSPPTSRGPPATEITEAPGTARWRAGGRLPVSRRAAA